MSVTLPPLQQQINTLIATIRAQSTRLYTIELHLAGVIQTNELLQAACLSLQSALDKEREARFRDIAAVRRELDAARGITRR